MKTENIPSLTRGVCLSLPSLVHCRRCSVNVDARPCSEEREMTPGHREPLEQDAGPGQRLSKYHCHVVPPDGGALALRSPASVFWITRERENGGALKSVTFRVTPPSPPHRCLIQ